MIHAFHQKNGYMWCAVALEDQEIWSTAFATSEKECLRQLLENLPYNQPFTFEEKPSLLAEKILGALKSVLEGENISWDFKFETKHLPEYTQRVLNCLAKVPVGYVTTYKALAKTAGGGPRAVGQIMASNPFAPLVPCHRVIKADFSVGGFGGGSEGGIKIKRAMLEREDRGFQKPSKIKTECGMLELFPVGFLRKN
jgi:methylated-DNA-[protein]-cysteine S-methyltransferase